jgi:hypothetical protein
MPQLIKVRQSVAAIKSITDKSGATLFVANFGIKINLCHVGHMTNKVWHVIIVA